MRTTSGQASAFGPVNGLDERTDAGSYVRVTVWTEAGNRILGQMTVRLSRGGAEALRDELTAALEAYEPDVDTERSGLAITDVPQ